MTEEKEDVGYCTCCGVKRVNGEGECYTDCVFYEGDKEPHENPH